MTAIVCHPTLGGMTAANTDKLSVTLAKSEVKWARRRAKRLGLSLSAVVSEALRAQRMHEAGLRLLCTLEAPPLDETQMNAITREWE